MFLLFQSPGVVCTASAFRKLLSVYVFSYFPFGFEGRMWDLIVSVPDHCLSFYFAIHSDKARPYLENTNNINFHSAGVGVNFYQT